MNLVTYARRQFILLVCACLCAGCGLWPNPRQDEQKDPHYLRGKNLVTAMDFTGAVQAFEKALEANPRNASAHFELWWLYEQKAGDFIASMYHGERYLQLRPDSGYAEAIRQRKIACIQELAKDVPLGVLTPAMDRLVQTNKVLRQQMEYAAAEIKFLRQHYDQLSRQLAVLTNRPAAVVPGAPSNTVAIVPRPAVVATTNAAPRSAQDRGSPTPAPAPAVTNKTYTVKRGDTLGRIARAQGVSLHKIEAANPTVDPRKIKAGQVLRIPSS